MNKIGTLIIGLLISFGSKAQFSCATAVNISSGYSTPSTVTTGGSSNFITAATTGSCSASSGYYTSGDNYVYTFTTGANAAGYNLNCKVTTNKSWTVAALYTTCTGTSISGCVLDDYNASSTPDGLLLSNCALSANTTYYLIISRNGGFAGANDLSFDIDYFTVSAITGYEADDECASATTVNFSSTYSGITAGCYTPSAQSYCWGSLDNDSWLQFTASATTVEFDYNLTNCSDPANGIQFAMYTSCGSALVSGSCEMGATGTGTYSVSGLTIGTTYLLRIDGWAGNVCEFNLDPSTGVATTPTNDDCGDAETLTCSSANAIQSIIMASATGAPSGCSGGGTPGKGVWYEFTGTGQNVTVSTDNSGTNYDTQINIYSGTCASPTCVGGDDDSGTGTTSTYTFYAVNGTNYIIYVDGDGSAEGQFELSISCANCDSNAGAWD